MRTIFFKLSILALFLITSIAQAESYLETARALSKAFESAAKDINPSLVSISSMKQVKASATKGDPRMDLFKDFFGEDLFQKQFEPEFPGGFTQSGLGSGFIWDDKGHILTNNHVIDGADQVKVRLHDRREFSAKIIGTDPQTDIAVLKIEANNITPVKAGDSDKLLIGEWVVAAGNPFGLDHSITAGIVSAKGRSVTRGEQYEDFIQTDAAINVGNSGGPLLNLEGEVIGINTMILSRTGGNHGIGFAIPINLAQSISKQLINNGEVARGWLGIAIQDLNEDLRSSFNFEGEGVLVGDVNKDGPADRAGIRQGDIIISLNNQKMISANVLRNTVASIEPESKIEINLIREGREQKLTAILGKREQEQIQNITNQPPKAATSSIEKLGIELINIDAQVKRSRKLDTEGKVVVTNVLKFSPADNAGLQPNDVILKAGDNKVESVEQLKKTVDQSDLAKGLRLVVETSGMKRFVIIRVQN